MSKIGWGDLAVLFWAGYFLGFWTCAVVVMLTKYGIWPKKKGVGSRESGVGKPWRKT